MDCSAKINKSANLMYAATVHMVGMVYIDVCCVGREGEGKRDAQLQFAN